MRREIKYTDVAPDGMQLTYDGMLMSRVDDSATADGVKYTFNSENGIVHEAQTGTYVYAVVVDNSKETKLTVQEADSKVEMVIGQTATTLSFNGTNRYDVNGTGKTDLNDAVAAFAVYNVSNAYFRTESDIANFNNVILKADVNRNKKVDNVDVALVLAGYTLK